nr:sigma-70 family RNA polymerase sigma factor [Clostridium cylindrosporum]
MKSYSQRIIIKSAIKGDKDAYGTLIKNEKAYLYKIAYLYLKNEEDALEVLQEAVYRGFLSIHKLKNPEFFKTWITRILINSATDHIRKKGRDVSIEGDSSVLIDSSKVSVEEKVDLYRAIDLLNDKYKTVIIMKYFNDMKVLDIASIMDIPEGTVKTYLSRAKRDLKNILKEDYLND